MSSSQGILSFTRHRRLCISFLWDNGRHWQMSQNWTHLSIMFHSMVPVDNQFNFVTSAWDASCCFTHYSLKSMESKEQQIEIQSLIIIKNITLSVHGRLWICWCWHKTCCWIALILKVETLHIWKIRLIIRKINVLTIKQKAYILAGDNKNIRTVLIGYAIIRVAKF